MHFLENGVLTGESLGDIHTYIFQSDAQIYKKTVIIREKIDINYLEKKSM